jgi:hypothetical protein
VNDEPSAAQLPRGFFDFEDYKDELEPEMLKRESSHLKAGHRLIDRSTLRRDSETCCMIIAVDQLCCHLLYHVSFIADLCNIGMLQPASKHSPSVYQTCSACVYG